MENTTFAFGLFLLVMVIAFWNTIKLIIGAAAVLFVGYIVGFDLPESPDKEEITVVQKPNTPDNTSTLPIDEFDTSEFDRINIDEGTPSQDEIEDYLAKEERERKNAPLLTSNDTSTQETEDVVSKYANNLIIQGKRYVVVEDFYKDEKTAEDRLKAIENNNITNAKIIQLSDFDLLTEHTGYAIIAGRACRSRGSIKEIQSDFSFKLYSADIAKRTPTTLLLKGMKVDPDLQKNGEILKEMATSVFGR